MVVLGEATDWISGECVPRELYGKIITYPNEKIRQLKVLRSYLINKVALILYPISHSNVAKIGYSFKIKYEDENFHRISLLYTCTSSIHASPLLYSCTAPHPHPIVTLSFHSFHLISPSY